MKKLRIKILAILCTSVFISCDQNETTEDLQLLEPDAEINLLDQISEDIMITTKGIMDSENSQSKNFRGFEFNSGTLFGNGQRKTLDFANRTVAHTTQWVDLTISTTVNIESLDRSERNSNVTASGRSDIRLDGIGQGLSLLYRKEGVFGRTKVTPFTSARFHSNIVPSQNIYAEDGPMQLTVHANEFGWMWIRVKQNNVEKHSALYRFTPPSNPNSTFSGGSISLSRFAVTGGINNSFAIATSSYNGYAGWFEEQ
ncbi:hypothetical protein [Aquimarina litoralis]|uniref:hypothetical protein n=1 Tax=Aquimarina litoralis TaxID=584605 RepID=UPI001C5A1A81|nr:hypothetical protein [Aquimarina litoralis]MBW1297683.1 hypothetical protein [Aquimarina litoralis]